MICRRLTCAGPTYSSSINGYQLYRSPRRQQVSRTYEVVDCAWIQCNSHLDDSLFQWWRCFGHFMNGRWNPTSGEDFRFYCDTLLVKSRRLYISSMTLRLIPFPEVQSVFLYIFLLPGRQTRVIATFAWLTRLEWTGAITLTFVF